MLRGPTLTRKNVGIDGDDDHVETISNYAKTLDEPWENMKFTKNKIEANYDDLTLVKLDTFTNEALEFTIGMGYHGERYPLPGSSAKSNPSLCREKSTEANPLPKPKNCLASRYYYLGFLGVQQTVTCAWYDKYGKDQTSKENCRNVEMNFKSKDGYQGRTIRFAYTDAEHFYICNAFFSRKTQ